VVKKFVVSLSLAALAGSLLLPAVAAEKVKFSAVAPVGDLVTEADDKIAALEKALADNDSYLAAKKKAIPRDAGVLAVLAQAIAEYDGEAAQKANAPAVRDAAVELAKSSSLEAAKKALDKVKAARDGKGEAGKAEHAWVGLIDMDSLMAEVNVRNGKLRKAFRSPPADLDAPSRDATVLSVLAVAIGADTHEVKAKADLPKWEGYAKEMQIEMAKSATGLRAKKVDDGKAAFMAAAKSCNSCHTEIRDK
jgi:hypothetical protein